LGVGSWVLVVGCWWSGVEGVWAQEEVTGKLRKLHHEGWYDLYCSPDIIRVIQSKMIR